MKIKFIVNDGLRGTVEDDIKKAIAYFEEKTPLDFTYDIHEVNVKVTHTMFFKSEFDNKYWMGTYKVKEQLRPIVAENEYHAVVFIYDRSKGAMYGLKDFEIASWSFWKPLYNRTEYTEVATDASVDAQNWTWKLIAHEMMHAFTKRVKRAGRTILDEMDVTTVKGKKKFYHMNHDPYHKDGNYSRTLKNLEKHWDMVEYFPEKKKWKYFSANEVKGLKHEFVDKLDKVREFAGFPMIINSGYRTPEHNKRVGGVPTSAHLTGLAADIRIKNSKQRHELLKAAIACGFTRIGIGDTFVHLDIDSSKEQGVTWMYGK